MHGGFTGSLHTRGEHGQDQDWISCRILANFLDQDWIWIFIFEINWEYVLHSSQSIIIGYFLVNFFRRGGSSKLQRWSDCGFLLSDRILFLKNDIRIRSCFGWNHTIHIRKLSESVLCCTTYIFVLCLFCLVRQINCWSYFAFSWTRLVEVVTWQVQNACPA